jgi:S-DNA-T family DNA segregation ATPase FtsK/SpoIIIE
VTIQTAGADDFDAERIISRGDRDGGPVDPPNERRTVYATVTSRRTANRKPVVPAWMRNNEQRGQFIGDGVRLAGHTAAWHGTRLPKHVVKVLIFAVWGVFVGVGRVLYWANDMESFSIRQAAATANKYDEYERASSRRDKRASSRGKRLTPLVVVLFVGVIYLTFWASLLVQVSACLVAVPTLAYIGRPKGKPMFDRVTIGEEFIKLTAQMTRAAIMACQLKIKDPGDIKFPRDIYRDPPGWTADVLLPPGIIATDVIAQRDRLAAGFRLPKMQVWPAPVDGEHPGRLRVWVADKPVNAMKQPAWPLLKGGRTDYFKPFPYGFDERLRPVSWRLDEKNSLFGGIPGSGKSLAVRVVLLGAILDPLVVPVIFELKGTGDFDMIEPLCPDGLYGSGADEQTKQDAYRGLLWLLRQCDERGPLVKEWSRKLHAENKVTREMATKEPRLRPIVAVFDEVQELFTDKELGKSAIAAMTSVIKRGRALGIHVMPATQRIDAQSIPRGISSNIGIRLALACTSHVEVELILGTGSYARGARCDEFEPGADKDSGWGYRTGLGRLMPVRAAYVDNAGAEAVARRAIAMRKAAGMEDRPKVRVRSLLEDVRNVWPLGDTGWWLADILAALKALDDTYSDMDEAALSAALKAAGMKVEQVHRKVEGRGVTRYGLQLANMPKRDVAAELED